MKKIIEIFSKYYLHLTFSGEEFFHDPSLCLEKFGFELVLFHNISFWILYEFYTYIAPHIRKRLGFTNILVDIILESMYKDKLK